MWGIFLDTPEYYLNLGQCYFCDLKKLKNRQWDTEEFWVRGTWEWDIIIQEAHHKMDWEVRRQNLESEKQMATTKMIVWISEINVGWKGRKNLKGKKLWYSLTLLVSAGEGWSE